MNGRRGHDPNYERPFTSFADYSDKFISYLIYTHFRSIKMDIDHNCATIDEWRGEIRLTMDRHRCVPPVRTSLRLCLSL